MNFKEYSNETKKTAPQLQNDFLDQIHMAMGISTEANEILNSYKKSLAYLKDLDITNIKEEIGDLL